MSDYQVLARAYRPKTFSEVLGQDAIVQTLKNALSRNTLSHAYLFCGSRGTGKTTLARILAKALNCANRTADFEPCTTCTSCQQIAQGSSLDVLEIDGASHRGIDDIKTISESVGYCPANGKWKVYIIDEVHMLTKEAFNALLKTLEEPPAQVMFFFATTEAHKIPATIVSRCQRFNLKRLSPQLITQKLARIAADFKVTISEKTLLRLAQFAEGGLRDAESLFDQLISYANGTVDEQTLQDVLGIMPQELFLELDQAVADSDLLFAFRLSQTLFNEGKELNHFLEDLVEHYKTLLFLKLSGNDLTEHVDAEHKEKLLTSSKIYTQEQCLYILDLVMQTQGSIKHAVSPRIALEHLLTKIIRARLRVPVDYLVRRLSELEKTVTPHTKEETAPTAPPPPKPLAQKPIDKPIEKPAPKPVRKAQEEAKPTPPPAATLPPAQDVQIDAPTKARHDTLMQFAAVELEGTLQRRK